VYLGTWNIDDLLTFPVNTSTPSTWAAVDADSNPAYRVYEDETGTAILTGTMAKLDDANTTGFYTEQITLSAANGFEDGKCYTIYIAAVVGGVTIVTVHTFQVEANLVGPISDINDIVTATQTTVNTIDATTTNTQGDMGVILDDRLPAALDSGRMRSNVAAINDNTTAAAQLARSAATIVNGAAVTGTLSSTQMSTDLTEATDDHYKGRIIIWTSGVLMNLASDITAYNGTTKTLTYTVTPTGEAPANGNTFVIV
jgi:hypothetical protein